MKTINEILPCQKWDNTFSSMTERERAQYFVDEENKKEGNLDKSIYYCEKCKNKGWIYVVQEYMGHFYETMKECECKSIRKSVLNMKKSGLEPIIKRSTFDMYEAKEEWQKKAKEAAQNFAKNVNNLQNKWFFIGGGIGSGKTHLCTAIVREFLRAGKTAKYMLWVEDSVKLKAIVNMPEYESTLDEYRKAEVLYIDDFFKITKDGYGKEMLPTAADIRLAYEIINYRYQHDNFITIISSERFINELEEIDSAVGSRIYEKAKSNVFNIAREKNRNYRLRGMDII